MDIVVYMDYVIICGQRVNRPVNIGRSTWLQYWESLQRD
jgi:hypothetical protein